MKLKKLKKIDVKYYRVVLETQNNPEILKAELEDLVNEVWAAQSDNNERDDICPTCEGLGYTEPTLSDPDGLCSQCRGSGKRSPV